MPTMLLGVEEWNLHRFAYFFQQNTFIWYFTSMKAKTCLESATELNCCLLVAYLSSMEIGVHANQENQLANLVLTLF